MLSYRHGFHAGNFADVLKHAVLVRLLLSMQRKERGFLCVDTHAGGGSYDLRAAYATKTREYEQGIGRLWGRDDLPAGLKEYLQLVREYNGGSRLQRYPGSPLIAQRLMRPQDRLALCELHPAEFPALQTEFARMRGVSLMQRDGLEGLKAFLPPKEKRGLVLIDPPYERKEEYRAVVDAVRGAMQRFPAAVIALWYPLLTHHETRQLPRSFERSGIRNILRCELWVREPGPGMYGSGMLLVNPPWQLDQELAGFLPWLAEVLGGSAQNQRIDWLVPE